jgi:hypothetical protein
VAYGGPDNITTVGDVWRNFPIDQVIRAGGGGCQSDQVPRDANHEIQLKWLDD